MQTYGLSVGTQGPNYVYAFFFPLFASDGKTKLQESEQVPYRDTMQKSGNVFLRCRSLSTTWMGMDPVAKVMVVVQGGFSYKSSTTTWSSRYKQGNILISSTLRKSNSSCEYYLEATEYFLRSLVVNGIPMVSYDTRISGTWVYPSSGTPLTEASSQALYDQYRGVVLGGLASAVYRYRGTIQCLKYETGKRVFFNESEYAGHAQTHYESMVLMGNPGTWRACSAAQAAYVNAANGLPAVESNALANIAEISAMFAALLRRDIGAASRGIQDAWLAYRYAYTTTLLDVEEYSDYIQRILSLSQPSVRDVHSHGYFTDSDGWRYHVSLTLSAGEVLPDTTKAVLEQFGVKMSAVNAWDMVPYSFIVDWFIPVADALDLWESQWKSKTLQVREAWLSITSPTGDCYVRGPTRWSSIAPSLDVSRVRTKTIFMRIADAIALLSK